ncbi:MAG: hypothetical protein AAGD33_22160 [Actinomycetota bacterium]
MQLGTNFFFRWARVATHGGGDRLLHLRLDREDDMTITSTTPPPPPPPPRRTAPQPSPATSTARSHAATGTGDAATPDSDRGERSLAVIRPWIDPVVDEEGHDPRSHYVERFWLGVLGPTATWLLRRFVAGLDHDPDGYELDLAVTAREMGLAYRTDRPSPFGRAMQRCTMFGLAHTTSDGLAVRRRIPRVAHRHLRRMPESVQVEHAHWDASTLTLDELTRAHTVGLAMLDAGDPPATIEHQLVAIGVTTRVAADVTQNLIDLANQRPAA